MGNVNWNTQEHGTGNSFDPVPKGRYLCLIDGSEMKDTKGKKGRYIEFEFTIMRSPEGEKYKGRKLWARLNVHNPSAEAQRIGREQFNALAAAAGVENPDDSARLHNKLVVCIVSIEDGQQGEQNRINGFLAPSSDQRANAGSRPAAAKPAAAKPKPAAKFDDMEDDIPF